MALTLAVVMYIVIVVSCSVVMLLLERVLLWSLLPLVPTGGVLTDIFSFLFQFKSITNDMIIIIALPDVCRSSIRVGRRVSI